VFALRGSRALFAVLLSVLILAVPKCFLGDSPDENPIPTQLPGNNALNKGETRAMAWHDIGPGADEVSYWQWRSALNGQEEIHGTLVAPDGEAVPLLEEVTRAAKEFGEVHSAFRGTRVVSQVALLEDYDSRWGIGWQKHTEKYDQFAILKGYYHALRKLAQSIDIVSPDVSLQAYKLVVAPDLYLIPKERAEHLLEYVKNGGHPTHFNPIRHRTGGWGRIPTCSC
jgi:beta-galactosidase